MPLHGRPRAVVVQAGALVYISNDFQMCCTKVQMPASGLQRPPFRHTNSIHHRFTAKALKFQGSQMALAPLRQSTSHPDACSQRYYRNRPFEWALSSLLINWRNVKAAEDVGTWLLAFDVGSSLPRFLRALDIPLSIIKTVTLFFLSKVMKLELSKETGLRCRMDRLSGIKFALENEVTADRKRNCITVFVTEWVLAGRDGACFTSP